MPKMEGPISGQQEAAKELFLADAPKTKCPACGNAASLHGTTGIIGRCRLTESFILSAAGSGTKPDPAEDVDLCPDKDHNADIQAEGVCRTCGSRLQNGDRKWARPHQRGDKDGR